MYYSLSFLLMKSASFLWLLPIVVIIILFVIVWNPAHRESPAVEETTSSEIEEVTSSEVEEPTIGGQRDEHGCLGPAGYSFDDTIGACVRSFELTPDIAEAARLAVEKVGPGYALTVVSFNSYEEPGAYDIVLERGEERTLETVYVRNGVATLGQEKGG